METEVICTAGGAPAPPADVYLVPLYARDGSVREFARVSPEDAERVMERRWHLQPQGYAARTEGKRKLLMHRFLAGLDYGDPRQVDHRNGNRLDNRRENLIVVASQAEQMQNLAAKGASPHRGVSFHKASGKWRARMKVGEISVVAQCPDEDTAARISAMLRRELMPFAVDREASA